MRDTPEKPGLFDRSQTLATVYITLLEVMLVFNAIGLVIGGVQAVIAVDPVAGLFWVANGISVAAIAGLVTNRKLGNPLFWKLWFFITLARAAWTWIDYESTFSVSETLTTYIPDWVVFGVAALLFSLSVIWVSGMFVYAFRSSTIWNQAEPTD